MSTDPKTAKPEPKTDPKTEPAAAKADASPFPTLDPLAYWTTVQQGFQRVVAEAQGRAQAFAEQYGALEAQFVQRAQGAVATWAQLAQDAIAYGAQLSAEARRLGVDAYRKTSAGA
jgi:hypothetical protein